MTIILVRRGPLSYLTEILKNLPEGYPYEAGIALPDGTTFETLFSGGHDGSLKLLGGGMQTCEGEPAWTPPQAGLSIYDITNGYIWMSNNDGTWSAFCPCISGQSPGSSSGLVFSSSGPGTTGGGDDSIYVSACPGIALSKTLYLTGNELLKCTCFNGTFQLNWDRDVEGWISGSISGCPGQSSTAGFKFYSSGSNFVLGIYDRNNVPAPGNNMIFLPSSTTCSPLIVSGHGDPAGSIVDLCTDNSDMQNFNWMVTS